MYFPSRGGVRGGQDQFNWEDIKTDKFRENYLGHSVKAPVGRWQKGKDLTWYARDKNDPQSRKESVAALKRAEAEALSAALGHRPIKKDNHQLTKDEMAEVLKRGQIERTGLDVERIEGMGYSGVRAGVAPKGGMNFQMIAERKQAEETEERSSQAQSTSATTLNSSSKSTKTVHKKSPKRKKKHKKHKSSRHQQSSSDDENSSGEELHKKREKDDKSHTQRKDHDKESKRHLDERKQRHEKNSTSKKEKSKKRKRRHSTDESE